ncbi:MAG TPA: AraC family transcriptional regulator [Puia sp.]|nr:AraC family transcriptional regulator [Puia sp.]
MLNRRQIEVSARQFYFLNANDTIEIRFSKADHLKTCLILFKEGFVEDCCPEARFPNLPLELNSTIRATISRLLQTHNRQDLDDALFELIAESRRLSDQASRRVQRVPAAKRTTKEELYRRLSEARDFMQDNASQNLTIEEIAGQVCLNKFHFHYNFKEVYNTTPHRYFTELKLQKAFKLLQTQQHSVTEVCFLLGFESPGSFSNLFKRRFKISPSQIPNFR